MEIMKREIKHVEPSKNEGGLYFTSVKKENIEFISSGCYLMDCVLGGGWPLGRMSNVIGDSSTGKSLMAIEACANFHHQFPNGKIYYLETEAAFDLDYAEALGMPISRVIFPADDLPDNTVESWFEHLSSVLTELEQNKLPCLYIVDSLDALSDRAEKVRDIDKGTYAMNKQKLIGQLFRQHIKRIEDTRLHLMIVSQVRENIGVCFYYHSKVWLADGTTEKIGKIVNQKMNVEVLSYNTTTGKIEPKRIIDWHDNGPSDDFLKVRISGGGTGRRILTVTPNHKIFTPQGEVDAKDLKIGDTVLTVRETVFSEDQHQLILGSLLGDGSLRWECAERAKLRFGHSKDQRDYCAWKASAMNCEMKTMKTGVVWADTETSEDFQIYKDLHPKTGRTSVPQKYIDMMTPKTFAVWYMDDGTFNGASTKRWGHGGCKICTKYLDFDTLSRLAKKAQDLNLGTPTIKVGKGLMWYGKQSELFQLGVASYVHPNLRYKLKLGRPDFDWVVLQKNPELIVEESVVISTEKAEPLSTRSRKRYDLTVEDNATYVVAGVVVHNSFGAKYTRSGGKAMDFYATHLIWLAQIKKLDRTIKKQKRVYGIQVKATCKKNKVGLPFREAEYPILFGYGIDDITAMLDWLSTVETGELALFFERHHISKSNRAEHIKQLPSKQQAIVIKELKNLVKNEWEEIETRFIPTMRKYTTPNE